jgi:hypothetical protein
MSSSVGRLSFMPVIVRVVAPGHGEGEVVAVLVKGPRWVERSRGGALDSKGGEAAEREGELQPAEFW